MRLLYEVDLAKAEWVVTAYAAPDLRMIEVVETNKDPHINTGKLISDAPESLILHDHKLVGHTSDPTEILKIRKDANLPLADYFFPRSMSIRQAGKKSNHGLNYNMQYKRFALENEMDEGDARRICDLYRNKAYRGLPIWYEAIDRQLRETRTLINCFGDKRRFMERVDHDLLSAAIAFIPQSTVARVVKYGMKGIYLDPLRYMSKVDVRANVYDSLTGQMDFSSFQEGADQIRRIRYHMSEPCRYHGREFTIRTDVKVGLSWGEGFMVNLPCLNLEKELEEAWGEACEARQTK